MESQFNFLFPGFTDEEIACHEAGHAVMSIIEGLPFISVTIDPIGELKGHVDPGDEFREFQLRILRSRLPTDEEIVILKKYVKVLYAGPMSHGLYLQVSDWSNYLRGGNDYGHAYQFMEVAFKTESQISNMCGELRFETSLEISKEETKEKISKLAYALLEERSLTYQECKDLINETP